MRGNPLREVSTSFHNPLFDGDRIPPSLLGTLPDAHDADTNQTDFIYTPAHQYRLWQVWIQTTADPVLELEVRNPQGLYGGDHTNTPSYAFRLQMKGATREADIMNKAFNGELKEGEDLVLDNQTTLLLNFDAPDATQSESQDA